MAEPVKKDDALAAAVREAFQRHMEKARLAALAKPASIAPLLKIPEEKAEAAPPAANDGATSSLAPIEAPQPEPAPLRTSDSGPAVVALEAFEAALVLPADASAADPVPEAIQPASELPSATVAAAQEVIPPATAAEEQRALTVSTPVSKPAGGATDDRTALAVPLRPAPLRIEREIVPLRRSSAGAGLVRNLDLSPLDTEARDDAGQPDGSDASQAEHRLVPPAPANDRDPHAETAKARPDSFELEERAARRAAIEPSGLRPTSHFGAGRLSQRLGRDSANSNREPGVKPVRSPEAREKMAHRLALLAAAGFVSLLCIGLGAYIWLNAPDYRPSLSPSSAVTTPASSAVVATPTPQPVTRAIAAAAPTPAPAASAVTKSVKTTKITLDAIDLAVQDARERVAAGDVAAARLILERYKDGGDPRALFALAETYDPSIVTNPSFADAKEAQAFYEAAGKAGFEGTADRLAKLQVGNAN